MVSDGGDETVYRRRAIGSSTGVRANNVLIGFSFGVCIDTYREIKNKKKLNINQNQAAKLCSHQKILVLLLKSF